MKKLALAAVLVLAACGTKGDANNAVDTTMTGTPTMTVDSTSMMRDTTMKADSSSMKADSTMARDTAKTK